MSYVRMLGLGFTFRVSRHLESSCVTAGCTNKKLLMKHARRAGHIKKNFISMCLWKSSAPQRHRCWPCAPGNIFRRFVLVHKIIYNWISPCTLQSTPTLTTERGLYVWLVALLHISKAHKDNRYTITHRTEFLIVYRTYKTTAYIYRQYRRRKICFWKNLETFKQGAYV